MRLKNLKYQNKNINRLLLNLGNKKNNDRKIGIIDININTFNNQVIYFLKLYKLYYSTTCFATIKTKSWRKLKMFYLTKSHTIRTLNYNKILRKINKINEEKVLNYTHNLIIKGKILDFKLEYMIINKKIELLKLQNLAFNKTDKNNDTNLNLEEYNNNNPINNITLPLYQPFGNKDIRQTGELIFVSNNQVLSPIQTFNILNTLNSLKNLYIENKKRRNIKMNSVLNKITQSNTCFAINKNNNIKQNSNILLNSKNSSVLLPISELPNSKLSNYKLYNNQYNNTLLNKESFVDFQLPSVAEKVFYSQFLKSNFIKLQDTIKDLIIHSKKEFNINKDTVTDGAVLEPFNILNNKTNILGQKGLSISPYNSNLSILDYLKSFTKQKDIKIKYSQIVGYKFNIEINKMIKNIYNILVSFFIAINCIISKPKFVIRNDKIIIKLFFYSIKKEDQELKTRLKIFSPINNIILEKKKDLLLNKNNNKANNLINNEQLKNNSLRSLVDFSHTNLSSSRLLAFGEANTHYNNQANHLFNSRSFKYNLDDNKDIYYSFVRMHFKLVKFKNDQLLLLKKNFLNKNHFKFKKICEIISKFVKKPLELNLIRVYYPYYDSNIFVKFLALNIKRIKMRLIIYNLIKNAVFKKFIYNTGKYSGLGVTIADYFKNDGILNNNIPAALIGFKIRIAGRLKTRIIIPRKTVKNTFRGTITKNKAQLLDKARFTSKNKRGAFSFTVHFGQNLIK